MNKKCSILHIKEGIVQTILKQYRQYAAVFAVHTYKTVTVGLHPRRIAPMKLKTFL